MANKNMRGNDFFEQDLDVMLQDYLAKEEAEKQRKEQALQEASHTAQMNLADINRLLSEMKLDDLFIEESPSPSVQEDEHDLEAILRAYGEDTQSEQEGKTQVLSPSKKTPPPSKESYAAASDNEKTRRFDEEAPPSNPSANLSLMPEVSPIDTDSSPSTSANNPAVAPAGQSTDHPKKAKIKTPVIDLVLPKPEPKLTSSQDTASAPLRLNKKDVPSDPIDLSATTTLPTGQLSDNMYHTQVVPDLPDAMKKIKPNKRSRFSFRDHQEEPVDASAKSGLYVSLGIIMTVLALIGIVGLSLLAIQGVQKKMNQTQIKQEWNQQVFPLVASDVPEFDIAEGQTPSDNAILSAGIWAFILRESNANYETNEQGMLTVPSLDIELHIKRIFGPEITFTHQSLQESALQVEYRPLDEVGKGVYLIPSTPPTLLARPNTIEVTESGNNEYRITVSYMRPMPLVSDEELFKTGEVIKTKVFTYVKTSENDRFVIKAESAPA